MTKEQKLQRIANMSNQLCQDPMRRATVIQDLSDRLGVLIGMPVEILEQFLEQEKANGVSGISKDFDNQIPSFLVEAADNHRAHIFTRIQMLIDAKKAGFLTIDYNQIGD